MLDLQPIRHDPDTVLDPEHRSLVDASASMRKTMDMEVSSVSWAGERPGPPGRDPLRGAGLAGRRLRAHPGGRRPVDITAAKAGVYAMRVRYSNPEQSEASHYNPDPLVRHADITVDGRKQQRVLFPHSFHENNFWTLTVRVSLKKGPNAVMFRSAELPNFDGKTYISDQWDVDLRSRYAPIVDQIAVSPFSGPAKG